MKQLVSTASQFIDTVQGAKTSFVKQFVSNKDIANSLQSFIDAQTHFAKQVVETSSDVANMATQELVKYDVTKTFAAAK